MLARRALAPTAGAPAPARRRASAPCCAAPPADARPLAPRRAPPAPAPLSSTAAAAFAAALLAAAPPAALAAPAALPGGPPASSYYVSLGLFVMSVPGLWSLIKRAPKAKLKRKTFEVEGPGAGNAAALDARARAIYDYMKRYNYSVKSTGEVIVFEGRYGASAGQAAALVLYTFVGLASTALVLSIAAPGGSAWYALTAISPAAGFYYMKNAERTEEFRVKMVTSDDEATTDIIVEGDDEEIARMVGELDLVEKGMVRVRGLLER
jgi:hypothetical protein